MILAKFHAGIFPNRIFEEFHDRTGCDSLESKVRALQSSRKSFIQSFRREMDNFHSQFIFKDGEHVLRHVTRIKLRKYRLVDWKPKGALMAFDLAVFVQRQSMANPQTVKRQRVIFSGDTMPELAGVQIARPKTVKVNFEWLLPQ